jgi:sortase A
LPRARKSGKITSIKRGNPKRGNSTFGVRRCSSVTTNANRESPSGKTAKPTPTRKAAIESIGVYDAPVFDSDGYWALVNGIAHVPETSLPWSPTPQRNVYLAGHRMGFRGTWSRMIFYNLDELGAGDRVVLKDRSGRVYEYEVSEIFLADPTDAWVMGQVRGRDMVTLQTCTPIPTFEKRLIVRADRI